MSLALRIILVIVSVLTFIFVLRKIRKSQMRIEDSIFWLTFCLCVLVLSVFPEIAISMADLIGMESPVNFIFLAFIFILIIKLFSMSIKISQLEDKIGNLTQRLAIESHKNKDNVAGREQENEE